MSNAGSIYSKVQQYKWNVLQLSGLHAIQDNYGIHFSIGRPKHVRCMAGALEGDIFLGPKAEVRHFSVQCVVSWLYVDDNYI